MAAANDSQGLKIAVAVFVTLSVLLAVTTYFGFSEYGKAESQRKTAEEKTAQAQKASNDALADVELLRKEIGLRSEGSEAVKNEIKKEYDKIDKDLDALITEATAAVAKAQAAGAQGTDLEDAKARVQQIVKTYQGEPDKTFMSSLDRMTDLLKNLSLLTTQLSINYTEVKRGLEGSSEAAAQKVAVAEKQASDANNDLAAEQQKHVDERQSLLTKLDTFSTERARLETEVANLTAKLRQLDEDTSRRQELAQQTIRDLRDTIDKEETVLDRPDGRVTYVDYSRGEVHTDLKRSQGVRPQMVFAIFDAKSAGVPTDKPKGSIELIDVSDRSSVARILKTNDNIAPIRVGDIVYSAAWSPNEPMRFALIGKIDVNRDGVDDRDDLKRMIEAAGGIVDYDLPPPEVGRESGKLTGLDAWYVIDDRPPLAEIYQPKVVTANQSAEFLTKRSEAIREARLNGVRPIPIQRLLPYLGYDFAAPVVGRAEAVDLKTMKRVLSPKQETEAPASR
jgi:hypothetical protein